MKFVERTKAPLLRLFQIMQRQPLLFLALLLALQTGFMLESRALWFSDEIRYGDVFTNLLQGGHWLVLNLNGEFYPDKPPVFFWLLWLVHKGTGLNGEPLFFLGAAVSGFFFLTATLWLARLLGLGREHRLATGLVLLTTFYVVGLTHYLRMDLLFASLIVAAEVCLFKAWHKECAPWWTALGFLLMALAVLTKGPLGLALPLAGSVVYLWWVRNLRRLGRIDVWRGVLVALLVLLAWLAGALIVEGRAYLENIFYQQIYRRAVNTWHHEQPFYHYLITFPAAFMPWTLLVFVLPLKRLFSANYWRELRSTRDYREDADDGLVYCWSLLLSGFVLLSAVSIKIVVYLLPLFAPLAVIAARAVLDLSEKRGKVLFGLMAVALGLVAAVLPFANRFHPWPVRIEGLGLCGGTLLLLAVLLGRYVPRESPRAVLAFLALALTLWLQSVGLLVAPSLDAIMSPKAQAELMGRYIDAGYTPLGYKLYSGTYTYYAGHDVRELGELEAVARELELHPRAVLGIKRKDWERWEDRPKDLQLVHEQWIADRPYVLVVKGELLEGADEMPGAQGGVSAEAVQVEESEDSAAPKDEAVESEAPAAAPSAGSSGE